MKFINIIVFEITNEKFDAIGEINKFDSLIWPDNFSGYAQFELWAPITEENKEYLKKGHYLWCGGTNAVKIEIVKLSVTEKGLKINVKGRTLESLLEKRIIWDTYNANNKKISTIMYELVNNNCINPIDVKRKIPWLKMSADTQIGNVISFQKTGGALYDTINNLATSNDLGFSIGFYPKTKELIFKVEKGVDKTFGNTENNNPILFSTDLEDILTSSYYNNSMEVKNVSLVCGEGEGINRIKKVVGDKDTTGMNRDELYVDARDLQKKTMNAQNEQVELSEEEYENLLINRGNEKLSEYTEIKTFEAKIRMFGNVQYVYNKDYAKGDKVSVKDDTLGIMVNARITKVEETYSDKYELYLTFGYSQPTILEKVKRKVGI